MALLDETFVYTANCSMLSHTRGGYAFTYPATTVARPHAPLTVKGVTVLPDPAAAQRSGVRWTVSI